MTRLWKVPGTIAEYTVGTLIVLYQLSVLDRQRRTSDREQNDLVAGRPGHPPQPAPSARASASTSIPRAPSAN